MCRGGPHAYHFERELHRAYAALGCLPPTYEPRATGHVPEMLELIEILLDRGHAYVAEDGSGDIYFDVRSWPEYWRLVPAGGSTTWSRPPIADPRGKRDPRDFAPVEGLQGVRAVTASWPTPWGSRPARLAPGVLGDGLEVPRRRVRHPRRRPWTCGSRTHENELAHVDSGPGSGSRGSGCTTPGSPRPGRR